MKLRTLLALSIAAAFPLAAQAEGGKAKSSDAATTPSASQGASRSGADAMFDGLDKNKDGSLSGEEVKGSPHDKDFSSLDKNNDGKLSRGEHAAAPEHAGEKAGAGGTKKD